MQTTRSASFVVLVALGALGALGAGCAHGAAASKASTARDLAAGLSAELEQVTPTPAAASAVVSFQNATDRDVRVVRFAVRWSAGAVIVTPANLTVPARAAVEQPLRIGPEAGDLDALYAAPLGARVEVLATR